MKNPDAIAFGDGEPVCISDDATVDDVADLPFHFMSLNLGPSSEQAKAAIAHLAERLRAACGARRKPSPKYVQALGAIIGELLFAAGLTPPQLCAGYASAANLNGGRITYRPFTAVIADLETAGYVRRFRGYGIAPGAGVLTRFAPQRKLIAEFAALGIAPADHGKHFADRLDEPLMSEPIVVRAASRKKGGSKTQGRKMDLSPTCPGIARRKDEIHAFNEFLRRQRFSGFVFKGLQRIYNLGDQPEFNFDKGGRLYGSYQQHSKQERAAFRINDEPVVEIDIQACFLTILFAKRSLPIPAGDLYAVKGVPRRVVKSFITMTLGYDRYHKRWPKEIRDDFQADWKSARSKGEPLATETGDLAKEFPLAEVQAKVLERLPILKDWESSEIGWGDLFFLESEVIIATMNDLKGKGIPCLPVHDSIIVPTSNESDAKRALTDKFNHLIGVIPKLK